MRPGTTPDMVVVRLIQIALELPGEFIEVAAHDPLSAALVAVGSALVGAPLLVGGIYLAGAAFELVRPAQPEETHPRD